MCGHYSLYHQPDSLDSALAAKNLVQFQGEPRYNICPTQSVPIVFLNRAGGRLAAMASCGPA